MLSSDVKTSDLIKEFDLNGMKFRIYNVFTKSGYPFFQVYTLVNGKWQIERERMAIYPERAWEEIIDFIKHRATARQKVEEFLENL